MYNFIRRAPPLNYTLNLKCRYSTIPPTDPNAWKFDGTLMFYESPDVVNSPKIAAFGWNKCLVTTSLFMRGEEAWKLRYLNVPDKLKELHENGYKLVVFCNQSYIGQATTEETRNRAIHLQTSRMGHFLETIGLPFQLFVATSKTPRRKGAEIEDPYRKPNPGMWKYLVENLNGGIAPDLSASFYVGGAAGRPKEGPRRADHSDYDLGFAQNAKLTFHTDDSYFGIDKKQTGPSKGKKQKTEEELAAEAEKPKRRSKKKTDEEDEIEEDSTDDGELKTKKKKSKKKKDSADWAEEDEEETDEFEDVKPKKKSKVEGKGKRKSKKEQEAEL